jgi:hypothetical protein
MRAPANRVAAHRLSANACQRGLASAADGAIGRQNFALASPRIPAAADSLAKTPIPSQARKRE